MSTATHTPPVEPLESRVRDEVNALRGRFRVSQATLGRVLGVTQSQMSARLRGAVPLTLGEVEVLAEFFGTTPGYLLGYESAPRPVGPDGGLVVRHQGLEPRTRWFGGSAGRRGGLFAVADFLSAA